MYTLLNAIKHASFTTSYFSKEWLKHYRMSDKNTNGDWVWYLCQLKMLSFYFEMYSWSNYTQTYFMWSVSRGLSKEYISINNIVPRSIRYFHTIARINCMPIWECEFSCFTHIHRGLINVKCNRNKKKTKHRKHAVIKFLQT